MKVRLNATLWLVASVAPAVVWAGQTTSPSPRPVTFTQAQCAALPQLDQLLAGVESCKTSAGRAKSAYVDSCLTWWRGWPTPCLVPPSCSAQVDSYYAHLRTALGVADLRGLPAIAGRPQAINSQIRLVCAASPTAGPSPTVNTGLGTHVDVLISRSPTLTGNVQTLLAAGWTIQYGPAGKGTYADRQKKIIVIDSGSKGKTLSVVRSLAHESGHAMYTMDPYVAPDGLTKEEYVRRNTLRHLKDEGEATLTNIQVRNELLKAKAGDIGVSGARSSEYLKIAAKYPSAADRDKARTTIGNAFAKGERPSTNSKSNYGTYYGASYAKYYDELHPPAKKPTPPAKKQP
jgi:type VI secretion system secreted protein VgrG